MLPWLKATSWADHEKSRDLPPRAENVKVRESNSGLTTPRHREIGTVLDALKMMKRLQLEPGKFPLEGGAKCASQCSRDVFPLLLFGAQTIS